MTRDLMIAARKGIGLETTGQALAAGHRLHGSARSAPVEAARLAVVDQPSEHDSGGVHAWRGQQASR